MIVVTASSGCGTEYLDLPASSISLRATAPAWSGTRVAVVGDSFTAGTQYGGRGEANWVARTRAAVQMANLSIDVAVSAYGGQGYLAKGEGGHTFGDSARAVVDSETAGVVVFGGSNDINVKGDLPRAVQALCDEVRKTARGIKILIVTPAWPSSAAGVVAVADNAAVLKNAARPCLAEVMDPVADKWFPDLDSRRAEFIGSDGIHPTDAAHAVFADRIAPWIMQFKR